ncbi:MAG: flavin reductase, partial [Sedimenticola sp.]
MNIDLSEMPPGQVYFTMTQALIPRPIAWVLSENADGGHNLAPFSYFSAVSSEPPLVMLSIGRRPDGTPKDTAANIAA